MDHFEIEIKLPVERPEEILEGLISCGFEKAGLIREDDLYYNSEYHDVKKRDEALRIRKSTDLNTGKVQAQINFKGKKVDQVSMSRKEYETGIDDPERMDGILKAIGFTPVAGVHKVRQYLRRGNMTACLDRVEHLGSFLELEVLAEDGGLREKYLKDMEGILETLGLSMKDTVRISYLGLLMHGKSDREESAENK